MCSCTSARDCLVCVRVVNLLRMRPFFTCSLRFPRLQNLGSGARAMPAFSFRACLRAVSRASAPRVWSEWVVCTEMGVSRAVAHCFNQPVRSAFPVCRVSAAARSMTAFFIQSPFARSAARVCPARLVWVCCESAQCLARSASLAAASVSRSIVLTICSARESTAMCHRLIACASPRVGRQWCLPSATTLL